MSVTCFKTNSFHRPLRSRRKVRKGRSLVESGAVLVKKDRFPSSAPDSPNTSTLRVILQYECCYKSNRSSFGFPAQLECCVDERRDKENGQQSVAVDYTPRLHKQHGTEYIICCNNSQYHTDSTISWICLQVSFKDDVYFAMLFTLRESLRTLDSVLSRARSKPLRHHPWRLDSEALRLLQRWG